MKEEANTFAGKRILLVDDERFVREALRLLLSLDAQNVVEANNGAEAFSIFRQQRFDLVVTDYEMPFVKGNELATRIKQVAPQQPVLMITAFQHKPSRDNPVDAVVSKPFNTAHLQEVMAQLLNVAASRQNAALISDPDRRKECGVLPRRRYGC